MTIVFIRTVILYITVIIALRIMGKRQIGEMQPSEMVVTFMISDLAVIPMQESGIPLLSGIVPILTLILAEILLSYITMKSRKARDIISGKPSLVIVHGEIVRPALEALRMNEADLWEEMRLDGQTELCKIKYGIVETNGCISFIGYENSGDSSDGESSGSQKGDN